jgi:uncharacterized membrane protein
MYLHERRSNERISQDVFEALVDRAARRAAESDEIYENLYRRICQQLGAAVIAKGSVLLGTLCLIFAAANWKAVVQWIN